MKNKLLVITSALLLTTIFACGRGYGDHHDDKNHAAHTGMDHHGDHGKDGHSMNAQYKSAEAGSLKASFEFSTMADHMATMKKMRMPMEMMHGQRGDHHITLTLLNQSDGKVNMEVKDLSFTITGPDGKSVTKKAHVMHTKSMHHFGTDIHSSGAGDYKIKATFKHNAKSHAPEVTFKM